MAQDNSEVQWGSLRPILQDLSDRLARIEQFLAASGLQVPPSGSAPASQIPDYIVQLAVSGRTIQAIKEFRDFSGMGLKEAKAIIQQVAIRGY